MTRLAAYALYRWQPIETAPKDGTTFLAYDTPEGGLSMGVVLCKWDSEEGYDHTEWPPHWVAMDPANGDDLECCNLTHWMPLPEPPQ